MWLLSLARVPQYLSQSCSTYYIYFAVYAKCMILYHIIPTIVNAIINNGGFHFYILIFRVATTAAIRPLKFSARPTSSSKIVAQGHFSYIIISSRRAKGSIDWLRRIDLAVAQGASHFGVARAVLLAQLPRQARAVPLESTEEHRAAMASPEAGFYERLSAIYESERCLGRGWTLGSKSIAYVCLYQCRSNTL